MIESTAKIIRDSLSPSGIRLTTMEVVLHRFVLAEFNTHRAFSRNSASSRAIPVEKTMDKVFQNPAYPVYFGKEQKGMQSGEEFSEQEQLTLVAEWTNACHSALRHAETLRAIGLHKSLVNRLIEPFMWHTVIVTATDWANFFHQRCHPDAQPEMRVAAEAMRTAYDKSIPRQLSYGEYHLPYIERVDAEAVANEFPNLVSRIGTTDLLAQISIARCARVSYLTHDGKRDIIKDIDLYSRLKESGHWSPFEHVATPTLDPDTPGNFRGWKQYRANFRNNTILDEGVQING